MDTAYTIRKLLPTDAAAYKAMRLHALATAPGMFGNSHAMESTFTDEQWMHRLTNIDSACFGLYHYNTLIGITAILKQGKPGDAYMTQSYIIEEHRGKGLSKLLYNARFQWAAEHNVKRLVIGHRRSNVISMSANQRYGFIYTGTEARTWPDGVTEDMLYYELELQ